MNQNDERQVAPISAPRIRTFMRGIIAFDSRNVTIDCTVRDFSESGARLALASLISVPDEFELDIPQKKQTFFAKVKRRGHLELGVEFQDQRSGDQRRSADLELSTRVDQLEKDLASLNKVVKKLLTKLPISADDV